MKLLLFPSQQNVSDSCDLEDINLIVSHISAALHERVSSLHITKFTKCISFLDDVINYWLSHLLNLSILSSKK